MKDLGEGIFWLDKEGVDEHRDNLREGRIFLNELLLPCDLENLSVNQIKVINRFREKQMITNHQFHHRDRIAEEICDCLNSLKLKSILEIGCGKFPLLEKLDVIHGAGIEIDDEAIQYCQLRGMNVGHKDDENFLNNLSEFDVCVALYVFHFLVPYDEVRLIGNLLSKSGVILFNLIGDERNKEAPILNEFRKLGFEETRISGNLLSSKEQFFVLSGNKGEALKKVISDEMVERFSGNN